MIYFTLFIYFMIKYTDQANIYIHEKWWEWSCVFLSLHVILTEGEGWSWLSSTEAVTISDFFQLKIYT